MQDPKKYERSKELLYMQKKIAEERKVIDLDGVACLKAGAQCFAAVLYRAFT